MLNPFRRHSNPHPHYARFELGKDKDGHYFADPKYLSQLDDFQAHKQAADELNRDLDLLTEVRSAVLPLEGSELDKNPRPEIIAVTDLPVNGKSVDAVIRQYEQRPAIEAKVSQDGKTITLFEELSPVFPQRKLNFSSEGKTYEVVDGNKQDTSVGVSLRQS